VFIFVFTWRNDDNEVQGVYVVRSDKDEWPSDEQVCDEHELDLDDIRDNDGRIESECMYHILDIPEVK